MIDGGSASGTTLLDIDVSRLGEPTEGDGIMVVEAVNGGVTTAQTTRDAFTIGSDYLTAGAWEYQLFAGDQNGAGEDWFLRAGYRPDVPGFDTLPSIIRQADLLYWARCTCVRVTNSPIGQITQPIRKGVFGRAT